MIRAFLVFLFLVAPSAFAVGQANSTSGPCSPILTTPKGDVTIHCDSAGMTKAQADQQAREFAEILNKIRQENLNLRAVIDRLDSLKNDVGEVKKAVAGRRLNPDQRTVLLSVLKSAGHVDISVFVPVSGGPEVSAYAMDFVRLQQEAGSDFLQGSIGYGVPANMTGLQMNFNPNDLKSNAIPKPCLDYAAAITKYVEPVRLEYNPKIGVPSSGACWLMVAFKD